MALYNYTCDSNTISRKARRRCHTAMLLVERGLGVVPLRANSKKPAVSGGSRSPLTTMDHVKSHFARFPDHNYGIVTGGPLGLILIDVDDEKGEASLGALYNRFGPLPITLEVRTGRGRHLYFLASGTKIKNSVGRLGPNLDVRGEGGYGVGPHSRHPNGRFYELAHGGLVSRIGIARAPDWLVQLATARSQSERPGRPSLGRPGALAITAEVAKVLAAPAGSRNDQLNRSAFAIGRAAVSDPKAARNARADLAGAALEAGLDPGEIEPTIESGFAAGVMNAQVGGVIRGEPADVLAEELARLGETDADNAARFVRRHAGVVTYTPGRGWLFFDGSRWAEDRLDARKKLALATVEAISAEAAFLQHPGSANGRAQFAQRSKSAGAIDRMLDVARHQIAIDDSALDRNPWLLNVQNGTIDLRTGNLRPHDPLDHLTKSAPITFDPSAKCPTFKRFLRSITHDDDTFSGYLCGAVGYSLTGITTEQVFFFLHGEGSTGKSTFVNVIRELLGEYAIHTPTETLLVKQYDNAIPADLARLKGARLVTAVEANINKSIDEAKIKAMTGGDPITARHLRQNFFTFTPEFKLWMVANDFPRVRGTADSFWRRVRVIPFDVVIEKANVDVDLPAKLRAELPGILAWAVRGCLEWQRDRLGSCSAVDAGTDRWRGFADHIKAFIVADCELDPGAEERSSRVTARYRAWCGQHGEKPLSAAGLKAKLIELDLTHKRDRDGSFYKGLRLKP